MKFWKTTKRFFRDNSKRDTVTVLKCLSKISKKKSTIHSNLKRNTKIFKNIYCCSFSVIFRKPAKLQPWNFAQVYLINRLFGWCSEIYPESYLKHVELTHKFMKIHLGPDEKLQEIFSEIWRKIHWSICSLFKWFRTI